MSASPNPGSTVERPLWVIAFLLLGIVFCLLFFVLQSLLHEEAPGPVSPPELPKRRLTSDEPSPRRWPSEPLPAFPAPSKPAPEAVAKPLAAPPVSPSPPESPAASPTPTTAARTPGGGYAPLSYLGQTNYRTAITGTVVLHGTPPPEQTLDLTQTPYCAGLQSQPLTTRFFVVGTDGALANVLVFIREGLPKRFSFTVPPPSELNFANCDIEPYVSAITRGQALLVGNHDAVAHAFRLTPQRGRELNSQVYPGKPVSLLVPAPSELFMPCRCQIHPWETASVSVFDYPFFAVTGPDGKFTITNVPPGTYVVQAVHQKATGINGPTRQFTIKGGQTVGTEFVLEAPGQPLGR